MFQKSQKIFRIFRNIHKNSKKYSKIQKYFKIISETFQIINFLTPEMFQKSQKYSEYSEIFQIFSKKFQIFLKNYQTNSNIYLKI